MVVGAAVVVGSETADELLPSRLARCIRTAREELCSAETSFWEWEMP